MEAIPTRKKKLVVFLKKASLSKGLPNEVQFGEETRRELPVGVAYRRAFFDQRFGPLVLKSLQKRHRY